jgi:hypothetical protein
VAKETENNDQRAAKEWQRVARRCGVSASSPMAAVHVKPAADGVQVTVGYMMRAMERSEVRSS